MTSDEYPYWSWEELHDNDRDYDAYLEVLENRYHINDAYTVEDDNEFVYWEPGF